MAESLHPIRAWRQQQEPPVTLEKLATEIESTDATLSRIENGKLELTTDLAARISAYTGIPMRTLCPDIAKLFDQEAAE